MDVEKAERPSNAVLSDDVLSIVLAGGQGSRLHDLTRAEAKPALPVGPGARLIDFTLANIANSGIPNTMVLTQYASHGLRDHVERCWCARTSACSFAVLDGEDHGPFQGTAHAVASVVAEVDRLAPRHIVVLAGDHLYQMDYRSFLDRHLACDAEVTVGVVHVPLEQASGFGVLTAGIDYRISAFVEKPADAPEALDRPGHALASMGIYVFAWPVLRRLLLDMAGTVPELDFGKHVIPALVARGTAVAYALPGRDGREPLWQDLGTIDAYHRVQRDLAEGALPLDPTWPIAYTGRAAVTDCETIGLGSALGNVVLLPGARVGRNVTLTDAIVLGDAVIPDGFDLADTIARHGAWCTTSENGIRLISVEALEKLASRQRRTIPPVVEAVKAPPLEPRTSRRLPERSAPAVSAL
jgi:glucose-1-phosphate adenylyltransferase